MTKAELRRSFLAKRKAITTDERRRWSRMIADNFLAGFDLSTVSKLHTFIPIDKFNEVDTMLIVRHVWAEFPHIRTYAPRINAETGNLESVAFAGGTELTETAWGIHEPAPDDIAADSDIDLVITPGLAFDTNMHRVGYGKGFYDRFLTNCRADCQKVGVSFFQPVERIDDIHDGDVQLDFCVTPAAVFAAAG